MTIKNNKDICIDLIFNNLIIKIIGKVKSHIKVIAIDSNNFILIYSL